MQLGLPFDGDHAYSPIPFYFVRHRRARRYVLRVDEDGRVRVTIPRGGSRRDAVAFGLQHLQWITLQRARVRPRRAAAPDSREWRVRAAAELPQRVSELASRCGVVVSRVSVRDQRTRWGSCGADGHICLNWRLLLMPAAVRDYVIVHELMHLKRMDHSPAYWRLVAQACPDYQRSREWLREHGPALR